MRGRELRSGCYRGDSGQVQYIHPSTAAVHYKHADCSIHKKKIISLMAQRQLYSTILKSGLKRSTEEGCLISPMKHMFIAVEMAMRSKPSEHLKKQKYTITKDSMEGKSAIIKFCSSKCRCPILLEHD